MDRPGAQPGEQPVAFTRAGPDEVLLAVNAYPAPLVDAFFASDAFGEPVIVVGAAWEATAASAASSRRSSPSGPCARSRTPCRPRRKRTTPSPGPRPTLGGTSYEETVGGDDDDEDDEEDEDDDAEPHFPLVIGAVLRFPENRKFPRTSSSRWTTSCAPSSRAARWTPAKRIDNLLGGT